MFPPLSYDLLVMFSITTSHQKQICSEANSEANEIFAHGPLLAGPPPRFQFVFTLKEILPTTSPQIVLLLILRMFKCICQKWIPCQYYPATFILIVQCLILNIARVILMSQKKEKQRNNNTKFSIPTSSRRFD